MKASDIPDNVVMDSFLACRGKNGVPGMASLFDIQDALKTYNKKLVLAKIRSMVRRKILDGCACGCRGDFTIGSDCF